MTYNFDPDKWYDNELFLIQAKLKTCKMSQDEQDEYDEDVYNLDIKHEQMWKLLDGTYQISNEK